MGSSGTNGRLVMYDTSDGSQDKYKAIRDSGANISFCNDISLFSNRTRIVTFPNCTPDPQEKISATGGKCLIDRGAKILRFSVTKVYASYI